MAGQSTNGFKALGAKVKNGVRRLVSSEASAAKAQPALTYAELTSEPRWTGGPPPASGLSTTAVFEGSMGDRQKKSRATYASRNTRRTRAAHPPLTFDKFVATAVVHPLNRLSITAWKKANTPIGM